MQFKISDSTGTIYNCTLINYQWENKTKGNYLLLKTFLVTEFCGTQKPLNIIKTSGLIRVLINITILFKIPFDLAMR